MYGTYVGMFFFVEMTSHTHAKATKGEKTEVLVNSKKEGERDETKQHKKPFLIEKSSNNTFKDSITVRQSPCFIFFFG